MCSLFQLLKLENKTKFQEAIQTETNLHTFVVKELYLHYFFICFESLGQNGIIHSRCCIYMQFHERKLSIFTPCFIHLKQFVEESVKLWSIIALESPWLDIFLSLNSVKSEMNLNCFDFSITSDMIQSIRNIHKYVFINQIF